MDGCTQEFQRITNKNLPNTFYFELDRHIPQLMTLFRQKASKTGKTAQALAEILKIHDEQEESEPELGNIPVALLTVIEDNGSSSLLHYQPVKICVVLESEVVVHRPRLADGVLVMFGLIYTLHLSYPMGMTNTLEFIQKILLGLEDGKLSPKLETLKNDLMAHV
ncbi:sterile alpha motif domain-containing 3 [Labeo rohita]|uniref:Sterile alpha motif domain-containing 3 n=1 Tax=Labeo rohita TaxID=84645 RepID=A0A498NXS2_LABRO|nr:sterile alpha motif domain-containing 3 [Labeo rohita]